MQDLLGDLIPRGRDVDQSKAWFPTKGEKCSQERKVGGDMPSESSHEGEVAK